MAASEIKSIYISNEMPTLWLTKNPSLIRPQLENPKLGLFYSFDDLLEVNTDAYPTTACFRYDQEFMARKALTGILLDDGTHIPDGAVQAGRFGILVAGKNFGSGSAREQFVLSLKAAGIRLVVAKSIHPICAGNMVDSGFPLNWR